jgi:hypothetical protein
MGNPNLGKDVCVPVVAVDSMIIDLLDENLHVEADIAEAIEVLEPPPISLSSPAYAVYWLVALAPFWRSCLYTFSEILYRELAPVPDARPRLGLLGGELHRHAMVRSRFGPGLGRCYDAVVVAVGQVDPGPDLVGPCLNLGMVIL